jgi:hypothetical protein
MVIGDFTDNRDLVGMLELFGLKWMMELPVREKTRQRI